MRLVQRMANEMQRGQGVKTEPAFERHEPHLRHGGPCQTDLHADPGQHHQACEQGGSQTKGHQQPTCCRCSFKKGGETDEHETTEIHHTGMQ